MSATPLVQVERLRRPSAQERDEILALEETSFSNPWTPAAFDTMLESPASGLWVARDGAQIVAFCACYVFADYLEINTLAVAPARRRQGIGRRVLREILATTGARSATLDVRASNLAAIRLYAGLGFTVEGTRPGYYENPKEDGLILWLNP